MRIGPFEILETIGSGGGGIVYRAHHTELDRIVALKQIRLAPGPETERAAQRISREAKAMAAIESDYVVRLYSFQILDGKPTLEMEFVDDGSVETQNAAGPLSLADTAGLLRQALRGLCAVHAAGYLHRDIKPSNILKTRTGRYKLADFGISGQTGSTNTLHAGSVQYAAPEYSMNADDVDARADLYSLGFVAYEAALGRPAFQEVFRQHAGVDPLVSGAQWLAWLTDPAKEAAPLHHAASVPIELSVFISRLIAKDRTRRFDSAAAALDELDRLQLQPVDDAGDANYAVPVAIDPRPRPSNKWLPTGTAAGVVGVIAVASVIYAGSQRRAVPPPRNTFVPRAPATAAGAGKVPAGDSTPALLASRSLGMPLFPAAVAAPPPTGKLDFLKILALAEPPMPPGMFETLRGRGAGSGAAPAKTAGRAVPAWVNGGGAGQTATPSRTGGTDAPARPPDLVRQGVWIDAPDDLRGPLEAAVRSQGFAIAKSEDAARWQLHARGGLSVRPAPFNGVSAQTADYSVDVSIDDAVRGRQQSRHLSGHALEFGDTAARGAAARALAADVGILLKSLPR
jgi:tRNA A-37 threonylcarbamoyl transferase component Bud32